jgi:uroporphyrinogen decarboxylase
MTKRDRFLTAINNKQPDRVPVFANLTPQVAKKLGKKLNLPFEAEDSFLSTRLSHVEILNILGNDAVGVGALRETPTIILDNGNALDEFGLEYKTIGLYSEAVVRPLAGKKTVKEIEEYKFPDPHAEQRFSLAEKNISKYSKDYAIIGDLEATVFELAWNLVGLEDFLMDMYMQEPYIETVLDKCMNYNKAIAEKLVDLGCDMIWLGDDVGTQTNMMISPEVYKKMLWPRLKKVVDAIKTKNPKVKVAYHSCGSILEIIPLLIEAGIDVLNPIQPLATGMDLGKFKKEYGKDIAFFGGVDVQGVLPNGSVKDVIEEVKLRISQAGEGGGYILAPAHNIQPDTPLENIYAMYDAVKDYGVY